LFEKESDMVLPVEEFNDFLSAAPGQRGGFYWEFLATAFSRTRPG
jgi:hypothetical protein